MSWFVVLLIGVLSCCLVYAQPASEGLPSFDFTSPETVAQWQPTHHIARISHSPEGMVIEIGGYDPYTHGPVREFPQNTPLWLEIRLRSEQTGMLQIFYARPGEGTAEERSIRHPVTTTDWVTLRIPMPSLGPRSWLRIDPPGISGRCIVAYMRFSPRITPQPPRWVPPQPAPLPNQPLRLSCGALEIVFYQAKPGDFVVSLNGQPVAYGWNRMQIGYVNENNEVRWITLADRGEGRLQREANRVRLDYSFTDIDGARWRIEQVFAPNRIANTIDVRTVVTTNRDRQVYFLPMLVVFAGIGSFGESKGQALFAGLEYLENEPSSSEADVIGPASKRQVPDNLKITVPLMAIQAQGQYLAVVWQKDDRFCALFDSPDRVFRSGGHVMGLLYPGSNGQNREEGNLLPYYPELLAADTPLVLDATLLGGQGDTVVPAVQHYVRLRGLPPVPDPGLGSQAYLRLAAAGWLDSKIREGSLFRHALWPGFGPQRAADAAVWMEWIAAFLKDTQLVHRLQQAARAAIEAVPKAEYLSSRVSHVAYPVAPLVYGGVSESIASARNVALELLRSFEPDGTVLYKPQPQGPDYARTHWERTANGLTAAVLSRLLENALYAGDKPIIAQAIRRLEQFARFDNTVPRGAQTWEVPLHTPDILASAHIVRAYVFGYELTGRREFLQRAQYWAWTGIPFPYLVNPTDKPVGPYSTIPVLGATGWTAPVWFGLPVQWCGLVYADALYWLARHDPRGIWQQVADGITAAGIQHTWKQDDPDRQGLLPDFYHLREQRSDGPPINPGTVQANAVRLYRLTAVYDYRVLRESGLIIHAPGDIQPLQDSRTKASFRVRSWLNRPYYVLINGCEVRPQVRVNGVSVPLEAPHEFLPGGHLVLQVQGNASIEVNLH